MDNSHDQNNSHHLRFEDVQNKSSRDTQSLTRKQLIIASMKSSTNGIFVPLRIGVIIIERRLPRLMAK